MSTQADQRPTTAMPQPSRTATAGAKVAEGVRNFFAEWSMNILVLLFAWTSLVQAFVVPTGSMENTILIGDHLFVDKLAYAPPGSWSSKLLPYTEVKRGDIICFRYPLDINQIYVKRVIGIPGDHIRFIDRQLYLNGKPVAEPFKIHRAPTPVPYFDTFPGEPYAGVYDRAREMVQQYTQNGELVIPPGHYFAMGDNRDNSADSRYWGLVPRENIVGKPVIIWWSYDTDTSRLSSPLVSIDHLIDLATNFFTKTRWERTFQLVRGYPLGEEQPAQR